MTVDSKIVEFSEHLAKAMDRIGPPSFEIKVDKYQGFMTIIVNHGSYRLIRSVCLLEVVYHRDAEDARRLVQEIDRQLKADGISV